MIIKRIQKVAVLARFFGRKFDGRAVILEGFVKLTLQHQEYAQIAGGDVVASIELDGCATSCDGLFRASQLIPQNAQIGKCLEIIRLDSHHVLKFGDRLGEPAALPEHEPQVEVRGPVFRSKPHCILVSLDRLG